MYVLLLGQNGLAVALEAHSLVELFGWARKAYVGLLEQNLHGVLAVELEKHSLVELVGWAQKVYVELLEQNGLAVALEEHSLAEIAW